MNWKRPAKSLSVPERILKILVIDLFDCLFFKKYFYYYYAVKNISLLFLGEVELNTCLFPSLLCFPVALHALFVASCMGDEKASCILPPGQCGFLLKNADSSD